MNRPAWIVLAVIVNHGYINQRDLASVTRLSIGAVNKALKKLESEGYLDEQHQPTRKADEHITALKPQRAVILAAETGIQTGINYVTPKGLLEINGEIFIERIIRQLHEVGVSEIYIVVGYEMERFEYLSEKYGVNLITDEKYETRGSLYSLYLSCELLKNCYVINSSVWFSKNPFSVTEYMPWYGVSEGNDEDSFLRVTRKMELVDSGWEPGSPMSGVGYLTELSVPVVKSNLDKLVRKHEYRHAIWENALLDDEKCVVYARMFLGQTLFSVKTYHQYALIADEFECIAGRIKDYISDALGIERDEISDLLYLTRGRSNRLFTFTAVGKRMVLRVPGKGSSAIIDRGNEAEVYEKIAGLGISEKNVHLDTTNGYKISEYIDADHQCDPANRSDVKRCMELLSMLHSQKLSVGNPADFFERIEFYEALLSDNLFLDYPEVKKQVFALRPFVEAFASKPVLCHSNSFPHKFLFGKDGRLRLIDWEYSRTCDPLADVASFCVCAGYDSSEIESTLNMYNPGCTETDLNLVYAYCAVLGLFWSLWSEYQRKMGNSSGGFAIAQYRYARRFAPPAYRYLAGRLKQ